MNKSIASRSFNELLPTPCGSLRPQKATDLLLEQWITTLTPLRHDSSFRPPTKSIPEGHRIKVPFGLPFKKSMWELER